MLGIQLSHRAGIVQLQPEVKARCLRFRNFSARMVRMFMATIQPQATATCTAAYITHSILACVPFRH